jgi:hypothetical protein
VPSAPGPAMVANSSSAMPSPPMKAALTPLVAQLPQDHPASGTFFPAPRTALTSYRFKGCAADLNRFLQAALGAWADFLAGSVKKSESPAPWALGGWGSGAIKWPLVPGGAYGGGERVWGVVGAGALA